MKPVPNLCAGVFRYFSKGDPNSVSKVCSVRHSP